MSTQKHIARFEDVEEGEEFWSAEGRLYVRGFTRDPENGIFIHSADFGLRPDHADGPAGERTEPDGEFGERMVNFETESLAGRRFREDELVLRGGPGVDAPDGRVRFFDRQEGS